MPDQKHLLTRRSRQGIFALLQSGDRLDQRTFHERYRELPENFRAELVGGIVNVAVAEGVRHARFHALLLGWLGRYWEFTPGTDVLDNTTTILGEDSEPQPDASLRILGGQTHEDDEGYLVGAPEFVAEVASSSESHDLHTKRRDYEEWGVLEYLVIVVRQERVVWFVREGRQFVELAADADGILRSRVFPGLWLDPAAVFRIDLSQIQSVLRQGLAEPEHAEFVRQLGERGRE